MFVLAAGLPVRCLCRTRSPVRLLPLLQLILLATHFILVAFQRVRFAVLLEGVNDQIRGYLFPCFVDPSQNVEVFRHRNSLPIDDNGNFDPGVLGDLFVAVPRHTNPLPDCSDDLLWFGSINYRTPNRYKNTAGVQGFPSFETLPLLHMKTINQQLLIVAQALYELCI